MRISIHWSTSIRTWLLASMALLVMPAVHAQPSDGTQTDSVPSSATSEALPSQLRGTISSATSNLESALSNLLRSAPVPIPVRGSPEAAPAAGPQTPRSTGIPIDEYEAARIKSRADEKVRKNRGPVPITPDMCLDGLCVEQDLGEVAVNLNWVPPGGIEPLSMSYRKSFENCTKANQPLWADKAKKLCEFLILAEWRSKADLVAFFKENRQPVCTTGGKYFKLELKTPLGPTYAEVHFSRDGRPKIEKVFKEFHIRNKEDVAEWHMQIRKKHPYLGKETSGTAPWGGSVDYYDFSPAQTEQRYELTARGNLFAGRNGPDEGECTPARKTISVQ